VLIRHLLPESHRDVEVTAHRPDATLADLARDLEPSCTGRSADVWIDGCRTSASTTVEASRLTSGSTLSLHPVPVPVSHAGSDPERTAAAEPAAGVTTPRHRTGRTPLPPRPRPVRLPDPEPPAPPVSQIGMVAMAVSVLGAGVMVAVLGSWTYAAFAVIGPLMMLANTADSRVRRRWVRRRYARFLKRDLERVRAERDSAAEAERARRAVSLPGSEAARLMAGSPTPSCWERRPGDHDAFSVRIGFGTSPWTPETFGDLVGAPEEVQRVIGSDLGLTHCALGLTLRPGEPVAIVGPASEARALARSVLAQLAACHGPADLALGAVVDRSAKESWDWLAWLPHTVDRDGRSTLAVTGPLADELAQRLEPSAGGHAVVLLDDPAGMRARNSASRHVLRRASHQDGELSCIVVLGPADPVPATCRTVVRLSDDGRLTAGPSLLAGPATAEALDVDGATDLARHLARFDDPELLDDGRRLPTSVRLTRLLGPDGLDPGSLATAWRAAGPDPAPIATLGLTADGPVNVDLVADGPHALVVGTTGSGKSEALRSLVLSLASNQSPDHLVFVLIDFKGGSAFDACADLPHTVGLVTDLDDHLAARALRCLEAELRHREERFRTCGAHDVSSFRRSDHEGEPMPRLVVVVDEFAALAASLPAFVDSLVDIAQRGRSLGIHLVLATQRPGGAVTPAIRANIGLRLALRVQSADDSRDLIGSNAAAALPRHVPGRALLSFGPDEVLLLQLACASLPVDRDAPPVQTRAIEIPWSSETDTEAPDQRTDPTTDLTHLVDAITTAWRSLHRTPPRRPWPDPLPGRVTWPLATGPSSPAPPGDRSLVLGLADEPDRQRIVPFAWDLGDGPLLGVGLPGSGPASLAEVVVLAAARRWPAESCHVHVLDATGTGLVALSGLPHVGAVVSGGEVERQRRLVQSLSAELALRRSGGPTTVRRLLVVHGSGSLQARWTEAGHLDCWNQLIDLVAEGSAMGIHVCCTAETSSVPHRLLAACAQRLVFRLGDTADRAVFGVPTGAPGDLPPDRALALDGSPEPVLVHVARPVDGLAAAVARLSGSGARALAAHPANGQPTWVGVLPERVEPRELAADTSGPAVGTIRPDGTLTLPVGIADQGLVTAYLDLPPGAHAVVSGPPRSGRTTALVALAAAATRVEHLRTVVVAPASPPGRSSRAGPSPVVAGWPWPEGTEVFGSDDPSLAELVHHDGALLVLVDDADRLADDHGALSHLTTERRLDRHVVAAGRSDQLRVGGYRHWTREVRADGIGLLLRPDLDLDGDLVATRLPRRPAVPLVPGRGWLTGGGVGAGGFVQVVVATPDGVAS